MKNKIFVSAIVFVLSLTIVCGCGGKAENDVKSDAKIIRGRMLAVENTEEKTVCLTFDDGPTPVTERMLDVLKECGIKATFFVIGKNAERHKDILRRIFAEGHTVGIHTYSHEYKKIYASPAALADDIKRCLCAIKAVNSEYEPIFYRFPGGSFGLSEELLKVPDSMGLTSVDWNASCRDSEVRSADALSLCAFARETAGKKTKVIMLLHDAADKSTTADALPRIVNDFKEREFSFISLEKVVKIS